MDSSLSSTLADSSPSAMFLLSPTPQLCSGLALLLLDPHPASNLTPPGETPSTPSTAPAPAVPGTPVTPGENPSPQLSLAGSGPCWLPGSMPTPFLRSHLTQRISCAPAPPSLQQLSPSPLVSGPRLHETRQLCFCLRAFGGQGKGRGREREKKLCILPLCICFPGFLRAGAHSGLISGVSSKAEP